MEGEKSTVERRREVLRQSCIHPPHISLWWCMRSLTSAGGVSQKQEMLVNQKQFYELATSGQEFNACMAYTCTYILPQARANHRDNEQSEQAN